MLMKESELFPANTVHTFEDSTDLTAVVTNNISYNASTSTEQLQSAISFIINKLVSPFYASVTDRNSKAGHIKKSSAQSP